MDCDKNKLRRLQNCFSSTATKMTREIPSKISSLQTRFTCCTTRPSWIKMRYPLAHLISWVRFQSVIQSATKPSRLTRTSSIISSRATKTSSRRWSWWSLTSLTGFTTSKISTWSHRFSRLTMKLASARSFSRLMWANYLALKAI